MPTGFPQGIFVPEIALAVAFYLLFPPSAARFRQAEVGAVLMPMPEAAVDEDDGAVFRQHEIGPAGEGFVARTVDREAVAEAVEHRTKSQFGFRVPPADAGHDLRAFF